MSYLRSLKSLWLHLLFSISATVAILLGFVALNLEQSEAGYKFFGYWNAVAILFLLLFTIYKAYYKQLYRWATRKSNWIVVLIAIVCTTFLYTREGGGFKILFDEPNLSLVAKNIHKERLPIMTESSVMEAKRIEAIDKRPLLFPVLLATVHDLTGFRIENAFYLNFLLTALFLTILYNCIESIANRQTAMFAVLLALSTPLIEQSSSSGGFAILNITLILLSFWLACLYWNTPTLQRLNVLLVATVALAHTRYESAIFTIPVLALILVQWMRSKKIELGLIACIIPLLFLTLAWQFRYTASDEFYKQYQLEGGGLFSLSYIPENLSNASKFLFGFDFGLANNPLVSIPGCISLVILVAIFVGKGRKLVEKDPNTLVILFFVIAILGHLLLILSFTYGQLNDPLVSRLGLPFILLTVIAFAYLLDLLQKHAGKPRFLFYAVVGISFAGALPLYSKSWYTNRNHFHHRIAWVLDFHHSLPLGNYLFANYGTNFLELHDINNMGIDKVNNRFEAIKLHSEMGTYDDVFFVQSGFMKNVDGEFVKTILPSNQVDDRFILRIEEELPTHAFNFTRISKVVGYKSDASRTRENDQGELQIHKDIDPKAYRDWLNSLP